MSKNEMPYPTRMKIAKSIWKRLNLNKNKRYTDQAWSGMGRNQSQMAKSEIDKAIKAGLTVKGGFIDKV